MPQMKRQVKKKEEDLDYQKNLVEVAEIMQFMTS